MRQALQPVLDSVERPVLLETGCIRNLKEGTDSTLIIASLVKDRGLFYTLELRPEHIAVCREACGEHNRFINYVEGDSVESLRRMVESGELARVDFAFLDSRNDGDHIWREFKTIEGSFVPGSVLVVDDVLWANKGALLRPYLQSSAQWSTTIRNVENGMLVATRL